MKKPALVQPEITFNAVLIDDNINLNEKTDVFDANPEFDCKEVETPKNFDDSFLLNKFVDEYLDDVSPFLNYWKETITPIFTHANYSGAKHRDRRISIDIKYSNNFFDFKRNSLPALYEGRRNSASLRTQNGRIANTLCDDTLYYFEDYDLKETDLKKKNLNSIILSSESPIPHLSSCSFDENYAWHCYNIADFDQFRSYVNKYPIVL